MKKFLLAIVAIASGALLMSVRAGTGGKMDKASKKELRKEKREMRKEQWLHSVNVGTENQFHSDFPKAENVSWTEGVFAEATFDDAGLHKTAYYDLDNNLVGTTNPVEYSALPEKAQQFIAKKYPGYECDRVIMFDDNEANDTDMFLFNRSFDDEDNYFAVLTKDEKQMILRITPDGDVSFFQNYK